MARRASCARGSSSIRLPGIAVGGLREGGRKTRPFPHASAVHSTAIQGNKNPKYRLDIKPSGYLNRRDSLRYLRPKALGFCRPPLKKYLY